MTDPPAKWEQPMTTVLAWTLGLCFAVIVVTTTVVACRWLWQSLT